MTDTMQEIVQQSSSGDCHTRRGSDHFSTATTIPITNGSVTAPATYAEFAEFAGALGMLVNLLFVSTCLAFMVSHSPAAKAASKLWARVMVCFGVRKGSTSKLSGNKATESVQAATLPVQLEPRTGP